MGSELVLEKWSGEITQVKIGATKEEGGSRSKSISIGGQKTLPLLFKEGVLPNKPVIAFEVWDIKPNDWPLELTGVYGSSLDDPLKWVVQCTKEHSADLVCLKLQGAHPDFQDKNADEEASLIKNILKTTDTPLIIVGCGEDNKDNLILPACCQAAKGERCLVGSALQDNYKTLAAATLADGHSLIAESPIDVNIAKQLNILISDMGLPLERIVMNPTIGALGYGLEYAYSIMERSRLAALAGDKTLALPFICFVGQESWRAKEAKASKEEFPSWGAEAERGIIWEIVTAAALIQAGADVLVMRHPKAIKYIKKYIDELYKNT